MQLLIRFLPIHLLISFLRYYYRFDILGNEIARKVHFSSFQCWKCAPCRHINEIHSFQKMFKVLKLPLYDYYVIVFSIFYLLIIGVKENSIPNFPSNPIYYNFNNQMSNIDLSFELIKYQLIQDSLISTIL